MQMFKVSMLALGLSSFGMAVPSSDPLDGYTIDAMQWELETSPGSGQLHKFNGTIEKVYDEILQINPNYDAEFDARFPVEEGGNGIQKRTDFSTSRYKCRGQWRGAVTGEIENGIRYLRRVQGRPYLDAGKCSRVSCSWNAAIWWCNDESPGKTLLGFGSIADGAQWLVAVCSESGNSYAFTAGQVWHPTNWNVIVMNPGPC